jgi:integrase
MSVRKREWITPSGEKKVAWLVDYRDAVGKRRAKQFSRKKDADAFETQASWEVKQGTHTADSQSITVHKAGEIWLARGRREGLEQSTLDAYEQHLNLHIIYDGKKRGGEPSPIRAKKLNQLTKPLIEEFRDWLLDNGRSPAMAKRVLASLASIVKEAQRVGYVAQNVAQGVTVKRSARHKPKVVPPSKSQILALINAAAAVSNKRPMELPMLLTLLFAGLRASELRGLTWANVDLKAGTITIKQRADRTNTIGPPKSASGFRTIPAVPKLVAELRKWKLRCPASDLDLVFPSEAGTPIFHANLVLGFQEPVQLRAGLTRTRSVKGVPTVEGIFSLHDFRHACASLWIEQRVQPKRVQTWMGHHSIQVTFDTYGHLFAAVEDDSAALAALEAGLFGMEEDAAA